jgi:hypothetical protein
MSMCLNCYQHGGDSWNRPHQLTDEPPF